MTSPDSLGYPLRRWRLRNFKSVAEAEIELSPLTVLVGANSSGKSSLIQSVLVVVQAAQSYSVETAVPLNGPHVELGDFGDMRHAGATAGSRVAIGGTFEPPARSRRPSTHGEEVVRPTMPRTLLDWDIELLNTSRDDLPGKAHLRGVHFQVPTTGEALDHPTRKRVLFEARARARSDLDVHQGSHRVPVGSVVQLGGGLSFETAEGTSHKLRTAGLSHRAGIPVALFVQGDRNAVRAGEWVRRARHELRDRRKNPRTEWDRIRDRRTRGDLRFEDQQRMDEQATAACDRLIDLIVDAAQTAPGSVSHPDEVSGDFSESIERLRSNSINDGYWQQLHSLVNDQKFVSAIEGRLGKGVSVLLPAEEDERSRQAARHVEIGGSSLAEFLASHVLYLGPLRQDPQVVYTAAPTEQLGFVGRKGEFAFAALHRYAERLVACPGSDGEIRQMPLRDAVNHWLETFDLADAVETLYRPRLGLEPQIAMPDVARPLDMTAVGVGVSQLLPVLVMGLLSDPGSVLLIEQPELHLHPAMQQKLGDFLLACACSGRQVIVETHSDHLVTRLRRRIAEDEEDAVLDLVGLVFTERIAGKTRFRRLDTNRYGGFDDWPAGFFDQSSTDSQQLLRAGMRKKKSGLA